MDLQKWKLSDFSGNNSENYIHLKSPNERPKLYFSKKLLKNEIF